MTEIDILNLHSTNKSRLIVEARNGSKTLIISCGHRPSCKNKNEKNQEEVDFLMILYERFIVRNFIRRPKKTLNKNYVNKFRRELEKTQSIQRGEGEKVPVALSRALYTWPYVPSPI